MLLALAAMDGRDGDNATWVLLIGVGGIDALHVSITLVGLYFGGMTLRVVWLASVQCFHLRMVHRQLLIEYADILMVAQWHAVGIQKSRSTAFVPYQVIAP